MRAGVSLVNKKATQCNRPSLINHPHAHGAPRRHDADPTEGVQVRGGGRAAWWAWSNRGNRRLWFSNSSEADGEDVTANAKIMESLVGTQSLVSHMQPQKHLCELCQGT